MRFICVIKISLVTENQSNSVPRQTSDASKGRKIHTKSLEEAFNSASYGAIKAAFCPPKRKRKQKVMENDKTLSADEIRLEEKQQNIKHCEAKTNGTAMSSVLATATSPLSNMNVNQFNQTGICLLNINGVVVPAMLPLDKVNNAAILSNATGSNTKITQQTPTRSATTIANGAREAKTSTISQANDSECPIEANRLYKSKSQITSSATTIANKAMEAKTSTISQANDSECPTEANRLYKSKSQITSSATTIANKAMEAKTSTISQANDSECPTEANRPYKSFTKATKDIASNCTVVKKDSKVTSCPSSNLASPARTSNSMSQTTGNVAAKSRATRSSTRDQMGKSTAKGAREQQQLGSVASKSILLESAGNLDLKKLQSPESSCKSNICSPQSQASEDEVEKRGKHLTIDVLRNGNTELPSASQLDIAKVSTMTSRFFILMKTS